MRPLFDISEDVGSTDRRMHGVALGIVINNLDVTGQGRVQLRLPWLSDAIMPWARVATFGSTGLGQSAGLWWQPQINEEVVVGFLHGDVSSPLILGSLWNAQDMPPVTSPTEAINKHILRTPVGHEIAFDDALQTVTISTLLGQTVELSPTGIKVDAGAGVATLELKITGEVAVTAAKSISLSAPEVKIDAAKVAINGTASASLESAGSTRVRGGMVEIN